LNACQRTNVSCGSCCGHFNLNLSPDARLDLVRERTARFALVDTSNAGHMAAYRQEREQKEESLPRHNQETYVCPYFGIPRRRSLAGCMIHPSVTGNPHSQNFSFYGASICQAYDCPNKDRDPSLVFSRYAERFQEKFPDTEYGQIMSDTRLLNVLLERPGFLEDLSSALDSNENHPFLMLLDSLVHARSAVVEGTGVASFEFRRFTDPALEIGDVLGKQGAEIFERFSGCTMEAQR